MALRPEVPAEQGSDPPSSSWPARPEGPSWTCPGVRLPDVAGSDAARLDVEADVQDVAVLDGVGLPLQALEAATGRLCPRAAIDQVAPADHLAADEPARDVRVNPGRRLERRLATAQRPGPRLGVAGREEDDQVERLEEAPEDLLERGG